MSEIIDKGFSFLKFTHVINTIREHCLKYGKGNGRPICYLDRKLYDTIINCCKNINEELKYEHFCIPSGNEPFKYSGVDFFYYDF